MGAVGRWAIGKRKFQTPLNEHGTFSRSETLFRMGVEGSVRVVSPNVTSFVFMSNPPDTPKHHHVFLHSSMPAQRNAYVRKL